MSKLGESLINILLEHGIMVHIHDGYAKKTLLDCIIQYSLY